MGTRHWIEWWSVCSCRRNLDANEEEDEGDEADADVPGLLDLGVDGHEARVHVALVAEG